jgi:hypothetical protein
MNVREPIHFDDFCRACRGTGRGSDGYICGICDGYRTNFRVYREQKEDKPDEE